jgi:hypothetical protein
MNVFILWEHGDGLELVAVCDSLEIAEQEANVQELRDYSVEELTVLNKDSFGT